MGLFDRIFGRGATPTGHGGLKLEPHAFEITLLVEQDLGPGAAAARWESVIVALTSRITGAGVGEVAHDRAAVDERGRRARQILFRGPDAEAMWQAAMPALEQIPIPHGSTAVKWFGSPGTGESERVNLGWDG